MLSLTTLNQKESPMFPDYASLVAKLETASTSQQL